MDRVGITIVGAGVIGLSIAAELAQRHEDILVIERHETYGQEISSRNSEVVHAGIYYPEGSLKAVLCVEGARLLYEYCKAHSIPHKRTGKLIVAVDQSERAKLEELYRTGTGNGVEGLSLFEKEEVERREPRVKALSALYSENTSIVDVHSLMKQLYTRALSGGVLFSFGSELQLLDKREKGYLVGIKEDDYRFGSRIVINSAGLGADSVARLAGIDVEGSGYKLQYTKGSYFSYEKKSPVNTLVYPVPHEGLKGLGVHATLDLGGRLRFGPDAEYVEELDYTVDREKRDAFYEGASRMIHGLERDAFAPDMAGIRPKIKGEGIKDFVISHEADKGFEGFINLIGIESPGLTASLAIGKHVAGMVRSIYN